MSDSLKELPDSPFGQKQHAELLAFVGQRWIAAKSEFEHGFGIFIHIHTFELNVREVRYHGIERQTCRFTSASGR